MKIFNLFLWTLLTFNVQAQKTIFVRVYDLSGHKIDKGRVHAVTDTSLQLEGESKPTNISARTIGTIKTKHSGGNNVLIGAITGLAVGGGLGLAGTDKDDFLIDSKGEGAAAGALVGVPLGAAIGGLSILLKNSKTYSIDGDLTKWKSFQTMIGDRGVKK